MLTHSDLFVFLKVVHDEVYTRDERKVELNEINIIKISRATNLHDVVFETNNFND